MRTRFKFTKLLQDKGFPLKSRIKMWQVCKPYKDKDAIAEKLIALIEPCETEEEALNGIAKHYPIPE
ncbi:MAG: hypothetical protein J5772_00075 [Clostridia bacterium]|nr:hypothetical protein [Clostridia bacterium]